MPIRCGKELSQRLQAVSVAQQLNEVATLTQIAPSSAKLLADRVVLRHVHICHVFANLERVVHHKEAL